jgi:hypothetical protein
LQQPPHYERPVSYPWRSWHGPPGGSSLCRGRQQGDDLLTDRSHNAGDAEPIAAAQIASALGIKVYTIGAGTRGIA